MTRMLKASLAYQALSFLALTGCASRSVKPTEPKAKAPDMSAVTSLSGRFSLGHSCVIAPRQMLTAAHVIDPRPWDATVPLVPMVWSDARGHGGIASPVWVKRDRDLGLLTPVEGEPDFPVVLPVAQAPPVAGDKAWILGYEYRSKSKALQERLFETRVLRVFSRMIVIDQDTLPGSSGGCVINDKGEAEGILVWSFGLETGFKDSVGLAVLISGETFEEKPKELQEPAVEQ